MSSIWVDPEKVRLIAEELDVPADTVRNAWQKFMATAAELGRPWGDDDIGNEFAKVYEPALLGFDKSMADIVKHLVAMSDGLGSTGGLYSFTEETNAG